MFYANESQTDFSAAPQYVGAVEITMFAIITTIPCCVFLFVNVTMLFTLRSKQVFRETSRFILLFNLLFADTVLMVQSQCLYMLSACRITLLYLLCGVLIMISSLTSMVSPLTLVVMCLERYVAVCHPLRHNTIVTIRNTGVAIIVIWSCCSLNVFFEFVLLVNFSLSEKLSLQMTEYCSKKDIFLDSWSLSFKKSLNYFLFVSAGLVVIFSYISVMVVARSASTDKPSAQKARNTLLLHLVQLGLSLCSTLHNVIIQSISRVTKRITFVRIQVAIYICIVILPRCLSCFIYGLRDQTIRPVLLHHLFLQWRQSVPVWSRRKTAVKE